ncbi:MAG: phasin family protein [Allorhizobium sp.]
MKSMETALELQQGFLRSSCEGLVAEGTKLNGMYIDLAKTVYKPVAAAVGKSNAR